MRNTKRISSKRAFIVSMIVTSITILAFWLFGLKNQRSIIENALLSTITLSIAFFIFLFYNLYRGAKLQENLGKITDRFDAKKIEFLKDFTPADGDVPDVGEGIGGVIVGVLLWMLVSILFGILLWAFGAFLWFTVLIFIAMLYWIFYRAIRLVLKNAKDCEGQIDYSLLYAFGYTALYTCWIFGVIYFSVAFS